ncbi:MAG: DNA-directed polymerase subunit beta, partial [Pseudomonadota bacterium]
MLQEAVDALFDNGRRGRVITGANKRPLKSLSDMLKGKQGRFRQNLLGKRVDYSGRSVIVTGPELKLHQCGLPKKMALELFKPFIYARLDAKGLSMTLKQAKKWVEKERKEVWDILDEVIREHPVLLNRAPTLHRLGIQAFEPVLIEGKAIQLHPLVCAAFNADFDGDQMAVHVPLSLEAQLEARVLMMSTNNILSPANGKPIIVPSQDMVLGLYYLSMDRQERHPEFVELPDGTKQEKLPRIADMAEVHQALNVGAVTLHSRIETRVPQTDEAGNQYMKRVVTTPGRMLIGECLPKSHKVPFETVNRLLTKKDIGDVIDEVYRHTGQKDTVLFADAIMALGFRHAFKAGISFGKDDMIIPDSKDALVGETKELVADYEQQYQDGLITQQEKYNKVIDAWSRCGDQVANAMMDEIRATPIDEDTGRQKPINSIYMMSHSGARGSPAQMKQLAGMRGLMAKPSGEIIETPIISNFKEGLTVLEYFNSTHGARKGLADTALKTANSGYLTRRLVDVSQDCVVVIDDCGTERALEMRAIVQGGSTIASLAERILGRTLAEDIVAKDGSVLVAKGTLLDESAVAEIEAAGIQAARIRSPLICEAEQGVCATCYGRDLARGTPVNIGEAVGVIAAQSIGEPGTQLTMRTFHIGGAAQVNEQSHLEAICDGTVVYRDIPTITDKRGRRLSLARNGEIVVMDTEGRERAMHKVPYGTHLLHENGAIINEGDRLAEWDPFTTPLITEKPGIVKYQDLIDSKTLTEQTDEATGMSSKIVTENRSASRSKKEDLRPRLTLLDEQSGEAARYMLAPGTTLSVEDGQQVEAGDVLARASREAAKTRDIPGGLPRVAELFEARLPKDNSVIAKISGRVEFVRDYKAKRKIAIIPEEGDPVEYLVPK